MWRNARKTLAPAEAWASIVENPESSRSYKSVRGMGGFVRAKWDEVNEIVAAANIYTIKTYRSEEHTSELQSLMRSSYDVFCLKKKKTSKRETIKHSHEGYTG